MVMVDRTYGISSVRFRVIEPMAYWCFWHTGWHILLKHFLLRHLLVLVVFIVSIGFLVIGQ